MTDRKKLIAMAIEAMGRSYSPYSGFCVGAALLTKSGKIYQGCNIENAAYSPTNCAERTAFFKAVSEGERDFTAIALCGGLKGVVKDYCAPCGRTKWKTDGLYLPLRCVPPGNEGVLQSWGVSGDSGSR